MILAPVPSKSVAEVWPQVAGWIARLDARHAPWWRLKDPCKACMSRDCQLWLIWDERELKAHGCVITRITCDAAKVAEVPVVAGENMERWLHLLDDLEAWARREGCVAIISTAARQGWVKVLKNRGWRRQAVLMERVL